MREDQLQYCQREEGGEWIAGKYMTESSARWALGAILFYNNAGKKGEHIGKMADSKTDSHEHVRAVVKDTRKSAYHNYEVDRTDPDTAPVVVASKKFKSFDADIDETRQQSVILHCYTVC